MRDMHTATPTLTVVDPRALPLRSVAYRRSPMDPHDDTCVQRIAYDAQGRAFRHWDPRQWERAARDGSVPSSADTLASLSGARLLRRSLDAGWRVDLPGVAGEARASWDGRGTGRRTTYDALLRVIAVHETPLDQATRCVERFTYGAAADDAQGQGCRGRLTRHDDTAGTRHPMRYGILGVPCMESRRFLACPVPPDWPNDNAQRDALLETRPWTTIGEYTALGELHRMTDAAGHARRFTRDVSGAPMQTALRLAGDSGERVLVVGRTYNAAGQLTTQTAGNGLANRWTYQPADNRLQRACSTRVDASMPLQDLLYTYDPVGNVLSMVDAAQATRYAAGQKVDPACAFDYDTLYRLVAATGAESVTASIGPGIPAWQPLPGDALVRYRQRFDYDIGGNLVTLAHTGAHDVTHRTAVAANGNRSLPITDTGPPEVENGFDANGNLKALSSGQPLDWDGRDRLARVTLLARPQDTDDDERYIYDGVGMRVRKIRTLKTQGGTRVDDTRYLPGLEYRTDPVTGECLHVIDVPDTGMSIRCLHWEGDPPRDMPQDALRYGLTDHLGSRAFEVDERGGLVSQEWFHPYGSTAGSVARRTLEGSYKTRHYASKERDASGLYYYGFRYYAPWLQRWIHPDPTGDLDGSNRFAMTRGNPTSHVDVLGLYTGGQIASSAAAAALREGTATFFSAAATYATAKGIAALAGEFPGEATSIIVTGTGAAFGGMLAATATFAAGMGAAASYGPGVAGASGALAGLGGFALGAAPAILGHVLDGSAHQDAVDQVGGAAGNIVRETIQQGLAGAGPTIKWDGDPWLLGLAETALANAIPYAVAGAIGTYLPDWAEDIFLATGLAATTAALGTAVRAGWGASKLVPHTGLFTAPQATAVLAAAGLRSAAGSLGSLLGKAVSSVPRLSRTANVLGVVKTVAEKVPSDFRAAMSGTMIRGVGHFGVTLTSVDTNIFTMAGRTLRQPDHPARTGADIELRAMRRLSIV